MRIPNNTVQNKQYTNVNTNKGYLNRLNNQMATEKKISRPSDDPMIAIRALRLRNSLSEIVQYHGANVPDAQAWVDVTRSAISSTRDMISSLKSYADQGANGTNTVSERQKIYENIQALQKQIYSNGNATDAGMSVFTGYRTEVPLTFTEDTNMDYRGIADTFNASDVMINTYTDSPFSMESINALEIKEQVGKLDETGKAAVPVPTHEATKDSTNAYNPNSFSVSIQSGSGTPAVTTYSIAASGAIYIDGAPGTDVGRVNEEGYIELDDPLEYTPTQTGGHYDDYTVTFRYGSDTVTTEYSVSDNGQITAVRIGETDVREDRVNRIRLSYDNINTLVRSVPFGQDGKEVGTVDSFGPGGWENYWADGHITTNGQTWSDTITVGGEGVVLNFNEKESQIVRGSDGNEYVLCGKGDREYQYYGDLGRSGNVYSMGESDETYLVYRTALEKNAAVPAGSIKYDTSGEMKCFTIQYGDETYTIKKLDQDNSNGENDGKWWAVENTDGSGAVLKNIYVTQNEDKSFNVVVNDEGVDYFRNCVDDRKVFNVSANGMTVTSCYHESAYTVQITTSDARVATDTEGREVTAYQYLALGADDKNSNKTAANSVYLLADTGELVFGSDVAATLSSLKDIPGVDTISVKYDKSNFEAGELRPEHYFDVELAEGNYDPFDLITYDDHEQAITYTVGTGQAIKINTNADEVFDPQIMRQMDDILTAIDGYNEVEAKVNRLKEMQSDPASYSTAQQENIQKLLDAANKELDVAKNKLQRTYENAITNFGKYFDQANQAETTCGTVEKRLTLVSNRLSEEKTTVTTLASDNENVDITNVAVEVSEANLVYNAALMATGRIAQQSLVDYI